MVQPPDVEHKRKRDAEDYGQQAALAQTIVPQQQGASLPSLEFFFRLLLSRSALFAWPLDPCATTDCLGKI